MPLRLIPRETYEFPMSKAPGVVLLYRRITGEDWDEVNRGHYLTERNGAARVLNPETQSERIEAIWQRALIGWHGVVDGDDKPLPCNAATRKEFGRQFPDTRTAVLLAAQSDPDLEALAAVRPT